MAVACGILISFLVLFISLIIYHYKNVLRGRKKLQWLPQAPSWPIIGCALEFGLPTERMKNASRLTNNPEKMVYVEFPGYFGMLARNYEFAEYLLSSNDILDKSYDYDHFHEWLGTGLLTSTGTKWRQRRKILTPAFHFSILEQFVEVFDKNSNVLITKLEKVAASEQEIDIYQYVALCTLDIICESAMGVNIESQNDKNKDYVDAVKDFCRIALIKCYSAWKGHPFLFKFTNEYKKQNRRKEFEMNRKYGDAKRVVDDVGVKPKMAFLDLLLNLTIDGEPLSREDIREEVDTFMFEGHDTTSSAVSSTLFLLAKHPDIQELVRKEQKEIYGKTRDSPTTSQDLQQMKYLELVIKEALRLYPAVPLIGRVTSKDMEYKGHIIPKDTQITILIYGLQRDPDYFESPDEFKPERFKDFSTKSPFCYVPFSAGPRNCIGQKFVMMKMKCLISKIIKNYELFETNPPHQLQLVNNAVLKSVNGVKIRLRKHQWD